MHLVWNNRNTRAGESTDGTDEKFSLIGKNVIAKFKEFSGINISGKESFFRLRKCQCICELRFGKRFSFTKIGNNALIFSGRLYNESFAIRSFDLIPFHETNSSERCSLSTISPIDFCSGKETSNGFCLDFDNDTETEFRFRFRYPALADDELLHASYPLVATKW